MKTFKKVLLIVFLAMVWLNIGFYVEKSKYEADVKYLSGAKLNALDKFQLGALHWLAPKNPKSIIKREDFILRGLGMILGPILLLVQIVAWIIYGIIVGVVCFWHGVVRLAKFIFFCFFQGGFFKLIGPGGVLLVFIILIAFFSVWRKFRKLK